MTTGLNTHKPSESIQVKVERSPSFRKPLLHNLIWLPLAVIVALFVLEGAFRLAHVGEEQIWHPDASFGFMPYANKYFTFRTEGFSQGIYNSAGFNDREFDFSKSAGVVRIALLGDSKTEALQVERDFNFGRILEKKLNANKGNKHFEVMNFGVSGFSTGQEYLLYLARVASYKPDIVVVVYNRGDNEENNKPLFLKTAETFPRPYFSISPNGKLTADWSVVDEHLKDIHARLCRLLDRLPFNSRLLAVIEKAESNCEQIGFLSRLGNLSKPLLDPLIAKLTPLLPTYPGRSIFLNKFNSSFGQVPVSSPTTFDLPTTNSEVHTMYVVSDGNFAITANILCRLKQSCDLSKCKLVVACLPSINNDIDYFRELKHLNELARQKGFLCIDMQNSFPSLAPMQPNDLFFPSWHFTAKGHSLVADILYHWLIRSKLVTDSNNLSPNL